MPMFFGNTNLANLTNVVEGKTWGPLNYSFLVNTDFADYTDIPINLICYRGGLSNTNDSNLSNVGECVFFFPLRITRTLVAWAGLTCIRKIRIDSCETRIELFLQLASQPHSYHS